MRPEPRFGGAFAFLRLPHRGVELIPVGRPRMCAPNLLTGVDGPTNHRSGQREWAGGNGWGWCHAVAPPPTHPVTPRTRVWFHRVRAAAWALAGVAALIWWRQSIVFVIVASVYANVVGDIGAAEAADDRAVLDRIDRIETLLRRPGDGGHR